MVETRTRVLLVRDGARFECHGDGACCSDLHALGPLTPKERARIAPIRRDAVGMHARLGLPVLTPGADHRCVFFEDDRGCRLHRERGAAFKPHACRRFPFGAVRTPAGIRITTAHRCPCRSMGVRQPLDRDEARAALTANGRLRIDFEAPARIRLTRTRRVSFATYESIEANVLRSIVAHEDGPDEGPLPPLVDSDWTDLGHAHRAMIDGTSSGEALAWFGDALLAELGAIRLGNRPRPWAWAFERAERRASHSRSGAEVFADFAADHVWSLSWTDEGSLASTLAKLRVARRVTARIARRFRESGASDERAHAEAVAIVEVAFSGPFGYARMS